jgi:hypothetical protein
LTNWSSVPAAISLKRVSRSAQSTAQARERIPSEFSGCRLLQPDTHPSVGFLTELDSSIFQNGSEMLNRRLFQLFTSFKADNGAGRNLCALGTLNNTPTKSCTGHTELNWQHQNDQYLAIFIASPVFHGTMRNLHAQAARQGGATPSLT